MDSPPSFTPEQFYDVIDSTPSSRLHRQPQPQPHPQPPISHLQTQPRLLARNRPMTFHPASHSQTITQSVQVLSHSQPQIQPQPQPQPQQNYVMPSAAPSQPSPTQTSSSPHSQSQPQPTTSSQTQPPQEAEDDKRGGRYTWDEKKTRLMLQEVSKYVHMHGYPKTSHEKGRGKQNHPYNYIADIINNECGITKNKKKCDGRTVETKYDSLKRYSIDALQSKVKEFQTSLPTVVTDLGCPAEDLMTSCTFRIVEGQLPRLVIAPSYPHGSIIQQKWDAMLSGTTVQHISLLELVALLDDIHQHGYQVKPKRKSSSQLAREERKKVRRDEREAIAVEGDDEDLAKIDVASDSETSSSTRSKSRSGSRTPTKASREQAFVETTTATASKISQLVDMLTAEREQKLKQPSQQPVNPFQPSDHDALPAKPNLSSSYGSIEDFFAKEKLTSTQQQSLRDMGLADVDDLAVLDADVLRRAGIPEIAALRIARKIQKHQLPF